MLRLLLLFLRAVGALRLSTTPTTVRAPPSVAPATKKKLALAAAAAAVAVKPAIAAASAAAAEPHLGERVALALRSSGLPDVAIVAAIAAMPVVELRGAIPVGVWMGVPLAQTFALCVLGNMLPIVPLLLGLRAPLVQRLLEVPLKKARSKSSQVLDGNKRWTALAAFVGVPFPGTGAWTGAMIAFVLGMPFLEALTSIFAGVVAAGLIVSALTAAGKVGAAIVVVALAATFGASLLSSKSSKGEDSSKA
ncbi:hypothetical protein CTAYLR_003671 [Chrysophaeum taylorii]|uniref:Small multi-drug export protein n=1 Tax=Chrysophaeum taylorii TaxID=2483200 RepID=A0AAD7UE08_9STRA|nr:hypothetical protein CTAYLR_003671 [Chrysophaeum taylorii]